MIRWWVRRGTWSPVETPWPCARTSAAGVVAVASEEGTTRVAVDLDALGARVVAPRVGLPVRVEDVALGERIHVRATV